MPTSESAPSKSTTRRTNMTTIERTKHICIRCQQEFQLGSVEPCPTVPDGGEHETPHLHFFENGRLDGLCAHVMPDGFMCGYDERDEFIHPGGRADIACRRACKEAEQVSG